MPQAPITSIDVFASSDRAVCYEQYQELRKLGPVVKLASPDPYVVTRYEEVKAALADHEALISGEGVGFNPDLNQLMRGSTTLTSDPPQHELLWSVVATNLQPRAVRNREEQVARLVRELVAEVLAKGEIDGVTDLAQAMPLPTGGHRVVVPWRGQRPRPWDEQIVCLCGWTVPPSARKQDL
ncbi:hypothetical protein [Rhodococcus rhodochrous]|uniref:hypothetical protein n=1 Tax=Rhodococcus rhodochrous TaxID=1829 RepID=UPI0013520DCA|nr:hypothetical protein [Rhodococcus rhodochrous]